MASNDRSLSGRITRWRVLFQNTREILPEVPHLEGDLQELRGIADEVSALRAERLTQETKLREITLKIRKLSKKGDSIRGRIGAGLKGRFGFDSLLLIQFGFTPRKQGIDRDPKLSAEDEARFDPRPSPPASSPTHTHVRPGDGEEASGGTNEVGAPAGRISS
jgi:hypothetical protein